LLEAGRLIAAHFRRDALEEFSYRSSLALQLIGGLVTLFSLHYLSRLVGPRFQAGPGGTSYFDFACLGLAAYLPSRAAQAELARRVREAQLQGWLEPLLAAPRGAGANLLAMAAFPSAASLFRAGLVLSGGLLLGLRFEVAGLGTALLALILVSLSSAGLGLLSGALVLRLRRSDPVAYLLDASASLASGLLFPVALLPGWAQTLAQLLPATHALAAARGALLGGASSGQLATELLWLAGLAAASLSVGLLAVRIAVWDARRRGGLAVA
jgi:ABC-type multidrug transport system permease subunit